MKKISFTTLLLVMFANTLLLAQSSINLKGKIVDAQTEEGLPYAHVYLDETSLGTNSDISGNFHLSLPRLLKVDSDTLTVSFVGYQTLKLPLINVNNRFDLVLRLTPYSEELQAITVRDNYTVIDLVKEAIKVIPNNYYEESPIYLKGYHTERVYSTLREEFVRNIEAYLTTFRPKMHGRLLPQVMVDKARKKIVPSYNDFKVAATNGIIGFLEKGDFFTALTRKYLQGKKKQYKMQGLRQISGRETYYITVNWRQPSESDYKYLGEIYIDTTTLAFVRVNTQIVTKDEKGSIDIGNAVFNRQYRVPRFQSCFEYFYNEQTGKWYFKGYDVYSLFIEKAKQPDSLQLYTKYDMNAIERDNVKSLNPFRCLSHNHNGKHIQDFATRWRDPSWQK